MVEGRAGSEPKAFSDFSHGGRRAVLVRESAHEVQHLTLPLRHLSHRHVLLIFNQPNFSQAA
jgi:hypothetical protein